MRYFIRKIVLFSLFPVGTLFLIEMTISLSKEAIFDEQVLDKRYKQDANDYTWVNLIESDSLNIIAGSSSAKYGISCKELNTLGHQGLRYVNIAMDARDPMQTYFLLKHMDLNTTRNIYFSLDPWIYSKRYYRLRDKYLYLDFDVFQCFSYAKEHDRSAFLKRYVSFFNYLFNLSGNEVPKNLTVPKDYGSVALSRTAVNFSDIGDWFQIAEYGWSELQFDYLARTESLLNSKNINFFLFVAPKRSDYSDYYFKNSMAIHAEFKRKLEKKGINSPIFGKFDLLEKHGDSTLFAEAYHLNGKGQIKFSQMFYELSVKKHEKYSKDYSWFIELE